MNLEELRNQIDKIDRQIIALLGQRLKVVDEVGRLKQAKGLEARDSGRYQSLLVELRAVAKDHDVSNELVEKIYHEIHEAAIARQQS